MAHVDLGGTWHEASFRLVETYTVQMPRGWRIALDPQPYAEVVRVDRGRCRFVLGEQSADVGPGELGVLLPGAERLTEDVGDEPLAFTGFGFRLELFGSIELSGLLGVPLHVPAPSAKIGELIASAVAHGARSTAVDAMRARSLAELATAELVESCGDISETPAVRPRPEITAALALMQRDPSAPLDIAALAESAHLSPKHFARCFRDVVGVPPMAYLQAMRLSHARAALATTATPVTNVATDHGFADGAHFSRAFKRQYGVSPSTFRRRSATEFRVERSVPTVKSPLLRDKAIACAPARLVVSLQGDHP